MDKLRWEAMKKGATDRQLLELCADFIYATLYPDNKDNEV